LLRTFHDVSDFGTISNEEFIAFVITNIDSNIFDAVNILIIQALQWGLRNKKYCYSRSPALIGGAIELAVFGKDNQNIKIDITDSEKLYRGLETFVTGDGAFRSRKDLKELNIIILYGVLFLLSKK
jgi:hypothetical protein